MDVSLCSGSNLTQVTDAGYILVKIEAKFAEPDSRANVDSIAPESHRATRAAGPAGRSSGALNRRMPGGNRGMHFLVLYEQAPAP
jgi:hypothetical protein